MAKEIFIGEQIELSYEQYKMLIEYQGSANSFGLAIHGDFVKAFFRNGALTSIHDYERQESAKQRMIRRKKEREFEKLAGNHIQGNILSVSQSVRNDEVYSRDRKFFEDFSGKMGLATTAIPDYDPDEDWDKWNIVEEE